MTEEPESPGDRRPNDEPYYIDTDCPQCGTDLVYFDEESGWFDEFECPDCQNGIYMDVPPSIRENLVEDADEPVDG